MQDIVTILWDDPDDEEGNVRHIARHGVTVEEAAAALLDAFEEESSDTSGHPIRFGFTEAGGLVYVVFEWVDEGIVYPITAFEPE